VSTAIDVREVGGRGERKLLLRLPWRLYAGDPHWVPPLLSSVDHALDPRRHPFFDHAEARLFLAWRGARPVGRIAAIVNRLHNEYHADATGFWGFFEAEGDPAIAAALLDAAAAWLRERGMTTMLGPFNPSINAECGLLIDAFDRPPAFLMPYNPPSYPQMVEQAGCRKHKDLFAYYLHYSMVDEDQATRRRMERIAAAVARRHPEVTLRTIDMANYAAEVAALAKLFNTAREHNWGYVPVTEAEALLMAREMKAILEPSCVIFAEVAGELAGCVMGLPDLGPVLRKVNGRLFPFGWVHLLGWRRRLHCMRIFGAGVLPKFRNLGIVPILFLQYIHNGTARGYDTGELSWVAEDNLASVRTLEAAFGARVYKTYRVYERDL